MVAFTVSTGKVKNGKEKSVQLGRRGEWIQLSSTGGRVKISVTSVFQEW